jgi:hypothetical protein
MEWRHSGSSRPKNSECKNLLENVLPRFLGINTASSLLITFKRAKLSTRSITTHLCWGNWRIFWRKNAATREGHQGGLLLARQRPGSPDICNQEATGLPGLLMSWPPTLFSGSGPVGLTPISWTEKGIENLPFSVRNGHPAAETWFDGQLPDFFWVACKS